MVYPILISGKQGSGKSTLAKILAEKLDKHFFVFKYKFAEPLYEMQSAIFDILDFYKIDHPKKHGPLLQYLGTEFGRGLDPDIWVKCALEVEQEQDFHSRTSNLNRILLIDDLRFKNEFNAFPNAFKIRLNCERDIRKERAESWRENEGHQSEIELDHQIGFDMIFDSGEIFEKEIADMAFESFIALNQGANSNV